MTERTIPKSRIALNPIVIDDSKRQSTEHHCPLDEHALVERLKEWELEAHNRCEKANYANQIISFGLAAKERDAYRRAIDLIENGRVRQQHRALVPAGWSEVEQ